MPSPATVKESLQDDESPPPPAPAVSANDKGNGLYDAAHELHFVRHDAASAIAAWDEYLREQPDGPFAPEAHYNRALCLVRLARFAEARAALRPFRDGRYGPYRQREASRLIDAIADK
jgi:TolA-binding protein